MPKITVRPIHILFDSHVHRMYKKPSKQTGTAGRMESKMAQTSKSKQPKVSFDCSEDDGKTIRAISRRARLLYLDHAIDRSTQDIAMDVTAVHCNGNPLRLADLLKADDFNLLHDISGIAHHLDRETGELTDCFVPRFSDHQSAAA